MEQEEGKLFAEAVKQAHIDQIATQTQATATTEQSHDTVASSQGSNQVVPKKLEKVLLMASTADVVGRVLSNMKTVLNAQ